MQLSPIGVIESCFDEKFGTPRQPGLVPSARARLVLLPPYDHPDICRGLEGCSHVWLLFGFHLAADRGWSPTVRPPRLGGNRRLGVFATRSPFRPNPIGMSVVELVGLFEEEGRRGLEIRNHDLVSGTPVYDIKPYIPYSDAIPDACTPENFAAAPERLPMRFSQLAEAQLAAAPVELRALIEEVLSLDPRPAYRREERDVVHGVSLAGFNVRWRVGDDAVWVESLSDER